ncbi:MAG: small conductance mechanosensitive channel [Bradymonadia bacterium]|jgi:small conductance mechanosensitive channel
MDALIEWGTTTGAQVGLNLLFALGIFFIGRVIAKVLTKAAQRMILRSNNDETLSKFIGSLVYSLLLTVVVLAALSRMGIQTASFVAILGAAGLAVGLALQGSLSNFAAGVLMLIFRPFSVGEYIVAGGTEGVIQEIGIFTTTLFTPDNKVVIIGNSAVTGGNIENYSREENRRVDLTIGISYGDDIRRTREVILDELSKTDCVLADPAPFVGVAELGDNSVNLVVRPWCRSENYWDAYFNSMENIKLRLDAEGISFPFPQRDVHLYKVDAA